VWMTLLINLIEQASADLAATYAALILADDGVEITVSIVSILPAQCVKPFICSQKKS
jgi:hypothetical protein